MLGCSRTFVCLCVLQRARSTVPFNHEDWRVLGVWLARRCAPNILFWLPFYKKNGQRVRAEVGVESVMKVLAPKKKKKAALISAIAASKSKKGLDGSVVDEEELAAASNTPHVRSLFLHVRVVQRVDEKGFGFGQLRYICTDLGVSYRLGNTGHYWLGDHPNMFQLSCPNWNSSLSREELEQHLLRGSGKVFSSAAAFPTRVFIRGVLEGKGILAQCTLGSMTEEAAEQQTALAQEQAQAISGIAALKSGDAAAAAAAGASITAASSVLPMHLQLDAQTWTKEEELALALAMRDAVPFSFHPAPEVVSALPPLMHPNAMVHMPPAPTPTLPPATGVGDAVSALAFLSNHMGDHEGESKVPAGAYDSVHLSDSPVTSKEKRPVRFDRAGNKPTPVSDACLPFLQFSTVPSPSLPVSIVIPKPSFDEVVLATQAAGGSKQAGRVRTPRKAADQDRDKVIKAMQANAAVAVAFTEQNRLLNLYQSSFTPSAPVSSSIPLGTRLPTMLSTPVSAMSASSMSSGMGGGMSGSPTPGSSLADLVLPTSSSSAGAVPSLPLSFPPPPINFGSNTTATTTNMRLGSAHPHLIPPNSNTEASRAQRAYAAASIRQAAQEVEKMRQQQQQQKPHASPQPVQAQVHQSQLQPPPHQRAQTQPPPVPPPSLAALIPLTPLAPFTPMEALPASTLEMEFLLNGPPSSSLMRTPAPASGGASADDSSLLRGLDTPLTSHASHSSHPSLVFPSPFPLSNSAIHHVPLSSSSGFEDLLPGSPSPPLAWPHGMASPVPQAHPMSSPHAAAATTIKSVSSMQHGAANQRSSQSDVESAQQLLRRLETALRSRSDLQPIFLAAIQAAHAHAQQQQHAAAMAASLVDFAAAPPPPLQIVPLSSEQALSILRSVDDTVLRQWVSQTKLTEAQQQAWNATRKERQHIAEIDSYAKLKQSGSRATVHRM